jgi:hypothetical protein
MATSPPLSPSPRREGDGKHCISVIKPLPLGGGVWGEVDGKREGFGERLRHLGG